MSQQVEIVADLGNSYLKSKIIGNQYPIHDIPHAIKFLDGGSWVQEAEAAKRGSRQQDRAKTKVFYMQGRGAIVGKRAFVANYSAPKIGEGKYSRDYFRYLMAAQLLEHLPNGHDNIKINIAHPPNAVPYLGDLMRSVGGTYNISLPDKTKIKYVVREVSAWDEPSGSMYKFLELNTSYNTNDLNDGDTIFVCDFGGRISSMTTVEVSIRDGEYYLTPYFDDPDLSIVFEGGAQTIMLTLAQELKSFHADEVKSFATKLDRQFHLLESVFKSRGRLPLKGVDYDVTDAFKYAISPFLDLVQAHYETRGVTSRMVALTGGSTKILYDYLVNSDDKIIDHHFIKPVMSLEQIRFANLLGAESAILRGAR